MKIFNKYETKDVKVEDLGLKRYINLDERLVLKTHGRFNYKFEKVKVNIIEKLANLVGVPGHRGKKHKIMTHQSTGAFNKNMKIVTSALKVLEKSGNPIQILVKAVENSAPHDEVTVIEYGGARYPQAVDVAPTRRIAIALRNMVHGAQDKSFNKKKSMAEALADEILAASQNSGDSFACGKRNEAEKQADAAR